MNAWEIFYEQFVTYEGYKAVLEGLLATVIIAVCGLLIGFVIGSILAVFKLIASKRWYAKIIRGFASVYVALFRGTPMVVQLLLIHFVIFPEMNIHISPLAEAVIAFGMNSGAYICEIMRGGILSVDKGQMEAGRSLGLNYIDTMRFIVIPQAIKAILPALGNEFIVLLKDTSLITVIGGKELLHAAQGIMGRTYEAMFPLLGIASIYLVLVVIFSWLLGKLERRLRQSDRR